MNPDIYEPFPVPDELSPYIRRVLAARSDKPLEMEVFPRATGYCYFGCVFRGRWRGWVGDELLFDSDRDGPLHFSGQIKSDRIRVRFDGPIIQVFAEFKALGHYQLLGIDGIDTVDRARPPVELNPERCGDLSCEFDTDDLGELVSKFLGQLSPHASEPREIPDYLTRAIDRFESEHPKRIAAIAQDIGVSERQLRRAFTKRNGFTPIEFISVVRVTRALSWLITKPKAELAELAVSCGYSDQAHLTRAFQKFLGESPGAMPINIETTFAKFVAQCR